MVLVIGIVLIISLWPGQSVDQRYRDMFQEEELNLPLTTEEDNPPPSPTKNQPPNLSPGSTIKTPTQPTYPRIHTVTSGETLSSIAMKYYGTTRHTQIILDANKSRIKNKNQIHPSMRLIIPHID
ncbi:MAG: LysM peptidoglycan-binding domain-containing protein [Planctomycetes bacterium]|nr:LysM peptidoglycan-binding domain-containing protein [Planctomycetota bacterium]